MNSLMRIHNHLLRVHSRRRRRHRHRHRRLWCYSKMLAFDLRAFFYLANRNAISTKLCSVCQKWMANFTWVAPIRLRPIQAKHWKAEIHVTYMNMSTTTMTIFIISYEAKIYYLWSVAVFTVMLFWFSSVRFGLVCFVFMSRLAIHFSA